MMTYKKIFYTYILVGLPFFAKGDYGARQFISEPYTTNTISHIETLQYSVEPLVSDKNIANDYKKNIMIKDCINCELGYFKPDLNFEIISLPDNSVRYTRSDCSGFVRESGSRTWRNQNPGALRSGAFARKMGACGDAGGFAVFPTEEIGMIALKKLLCTDSYVNMTICDAIQKYAPFCDNNDPVSYQRHIFNMTGIDPKRKISDLSAMEIEAVANAIKIIEGWNPGTQKNFGIVAQLLHETQHER